MVSFLEIGLGALEDGAFCLPTKGVNSWPGMKKGLATTISSPEEAAKPGHSYTVSSLLSSSSSDSEVSSRCSSSLSYFGLIKSKAKTKSTRS
jgi:hypothetical protein